MEDFPQPLSMNFTSTEDFNHWRNEVDVWIKKEVLELEDLLLRFNSFDMIANVALTQLPTDWETYKEVTHEGLTAIIEYVSLLYLKHPYNIGTEMVIDKKVLDEVNERTNALIQAIMLRYGLEASPGLSPGLREEFRYLTITNELVVRGPGYYNHQVERLTALFAPVEDWLLTQVGFTVADALRIEIAISDLIDLKYQQRRKQAKDAEREMLSGLRTYSRDRINDDQEQRDLFEYLSKLGTKEAKAYISNRSIGWFFSFLGTMVYSFTAEEIAQQCEMDLPRAEAVLRFFSIEFGQIAPDAFLLSPTHELKTYPILRNDVTFLCPVPGSIIWAIQPRLEEILNPDTRKYSATSADIWQKYVEHRAKYLENEVARFLKLALQHVDVYQNLSYEVVENNTKKATELDGLICFDTSMFLIETKAGTFTAPARRGAKERMVGDLKDLLGVAHSQALRAKRYIDSHDAPAFTLQDGTKINIDKQHFKRVILVAVTLEPLDVFNTVIYNLAKIGVLQEGELPWAVSLDSLRVICELIEFPTQFIHYLVRRLRLNEIQKVSAHDELDWFGHYLSTGLFFEDEAQSEDTYFLLSHTTDFDDYYLYEMGVRTKPVPKPRQRVPKRLREIIRELEEAHFFGYSEIILGLLNYNDDARIAFSKLFDRIRKMSKRDGRRHDLTVVSSDAKSGITCFSTVSRMKERTYAELHTFAGLKKYQHQADHWLGILTVVDRPQLIDGVVILNSPWAPDPKLDSLMVDFFPKKIID